MTTSCKIEIVGRLGQDAKTLTKEGMEIVKLSVATKDTYKSHKSGEVVKKTCWHDVLIFDPETVATAKNLHKGAKVYLKGTLSYRSVKTDEGFKIQQATIVVRENNL